MFSHIEYPLELADIVIVGLLSPRARSFTVRPRLHGEYVLTFWPRHFPELRWVARYPLNFPTHLSPAARIIFDLDAQRHRGPLDWQWSLVRRDSAADRIPVSEALFSDRNIARGEIHFDEGFDPMEVRTVVWSCNQPFMTEQNQAKLDPHTTAILPWYQALVEQFAPSSIWGLGDTAYSDGTPATNFADQIYNNEGWHLDPGNQNWLRDAYRRMYRYHWSFEAFQNTMRSIPHLLTWDDHEIRDGWGSEQADFTEGNQEMFRIAREVAEEYVLNVGPRMRPTGDAHKAYILGPQAAFVFDARTSRAYANPEGKIISSEQLDDFRRFNQLIAKSPNVHFYFLGTTVPFVYLKDIFEKLGSLAPRLVTDPIAGARDDMRDSWHSPGNRAALRQVLNELRDLLAARPDLHVVNISGDIHVANAFEIWPLGFSRPFYQVTTSALTNRSHLPELASEVMALNQIDFLEELGLVRRLWAEIVDPNVLCITTTPNQAKLNLRVLPVDGSKATDQELVLS